MARLLRELPEMTEQDRDEWQDFTSETRFFKVSKETYSWLEEHGQLAAVSLCGDQTISVTAELDGDRWGGWNWMHDEFINSGLNPRDFGF
jgi:hypothetical protein